MKKQVLFFIMLLLSVIAKADDSGQCGENLTWTYVEATRTLTISGYGEMYNYGSNYAPWCNNYQNELETVIIEDGVTSIGSSAFYFCFGLTSIEIPNSVTSIGQYAFHHCSGLTSIEIPNSVTSIGDYAFRYCSGLTSIEIPNSVTSIGSSAFSYCSGLTSVTFHCPTVGSWFSGLTSIKEVVIGKEVTNIEKSAFSGCSGLTSIEIGNSVTSIGSSAFSGCSGLTSVTFHCPTVGSWFSNVTSIKEVVIGKEVTSIGNSAFGSSAFGNCRGLTSIIVEEGNAVYDSRRNCNAIIKTTSNTLITGCMNTTIPNSVTSIGSSAFGNCRGLTSIEIPNSVTSIGSSAFGNCRGLTSIEIPNSVTSIGSSAFSGCSGLTSVVIGNNVISIGSSVFYGCSGLTSLVIGTGVTSIGENSFYNTNLKKTIWLTNTPPSGYSYAKGVVNYVANEQYGALGNCIVYPFLSSLFEVDGIKYVPVSPSERTCDAIDCVYNSTAVNTVISPTVTYKGVSMNVRKIQPYVCYGNSFIKNLTCDCTGAIAQNAFANCSNLEDVTCNNNGEIGDYAFSGCSALKDVTLGRYVSSIGNYTFSGCSSLQSVIIPDSVTTIGDYSFQNCTSLTSIIIGAQVAKLGTYSFSGCSGLKEVTLGARVKTIGASSFSGCSSLPVISIPKSVTTINSSVFYGCKGLKNIIIEDREDELSLGSNGSSPLFSDCPLDSVYIGGNITYNTSKDYGYSPFYRNTTLRTVVITDKETEISPYEFYGCTNLQNFTIGDGVTSFGDWAFSGCSSLKSLSFGSELKSIGREAFSDCASVTKIFSKAATPPTCGSQALDDINKWTCSLYVPEGSLSSYQAAEQWKEFFFVEEGDGEQEIPGEPVEKKCAKPSIHYSNGKLMFECDTEGATFVITQFQITPPSVGEVAGNMMNLVLNCNVSFYAKATGYENSDIVTQTLTLEGDGFDPNGDGKPTLKDITRFIDLYLHSK